MKVPVLITMQSKNQFLPQQKFFCNPSLALTDGTSLPSLGLQIPNELRLKTLFGDEAEMPLLFHFGYTALHVVALPENHSIVRLDGVCPRSSRRCEPKRFSSLTR